MRILNATEPFLWLFFGALAATAFAVEPCCREDVSPTLAEDFFIHYPSCQTTGRLIYRQAANDTPLLSGRLLDAAPVAGWCYATATTYGVTDSEGGFRYGAADTEIVFYLGGIVLPLAVPEPMVTPMDFASGDTAGLPPRTRMPEIGNVTMDLHNPQVGNVTRFLQALRDIPIDEALRQKAVQLALSFQVDKAIFEQSAREVLAQLAENVALPDLPAAQKNLQQTLAEQACSWFELEYYDPYYRALSIAPIGHVVGQDKSHLTLGFSPGSNPFNTAEWPADKARFGLEIGVELPQTDSKHTSAEIDHWLQQQRYSVQVQLSVQQDMVNTSLAAFEYRVTLDSIANKGQFKVRRYTVAGQQGYQLLLNNLVLPLSSSPHMAASIADSVTLDSAAICGDAAHMSTGG